MSEQRTAWLYTNGRESVRLEAARQGDVFQLRISGPRKKRGVLDFADFAALILYQTEYESRLIADGYILEQYASERRQARP